MASTRSYTYIGAFLLGIIVLATAGILIFGGTHLFSQQRQAIIFFNQSVLGLSKGGRVLFRGVQIGTVQNVQLRVDPKSSHARIAVTISMTGQAVELNGTKRPAKLTVPQMVKRGLRGQLVIYSYVTSELAVNLSFKPDSKPKYVVNPSKLSLPEIPAVQSQIQKLKNTVMDLPWQQTLNNVNQTMQSMVTLANDMDDTINDLKPQLSQTTGNVNKTLATVQQAIQANNQQLKQTIAGVQKLSNSAHDLTSTANKQLAARGQQLDKVLANAQKTTEQLNKLTNNMNTLVAPGDKSRHNIDNILRDLSATAANLRDFTQTIERNPHSLIYGGGSR